MIRRGEVSVNGHIVTAPGSKADLRVDQISVRGRPLRAPTAQCYFLFNKPTGVVTTLSDPEGRPCVGDVIAELRLPLHPVGRLDFHTSGLLLLTNDGELTARLTHARHGVPKTYVAKVDRAPTTEELARLRKGVALGDGRTAYGEVRAWSTKAVDKARLTITIVEGRNRQVRRMLEAVGLHVLKLRRVAVGPVALGSLASGATRRLTREEIASLQRATGLA
jgi:23S rRNA pseudouridine2605 synthase